MGSYLSIITLTVNGLIGPTKRQRLPEWIQKQDPYICCLQETHLKPRDTYRLIVKGWKKIFHANGNQKEKKSRSSNTHIRQNRLWNKGREKRQRKTLHNDQRINPRRRYKIINIYAPNIGAPQYVRQMLTSMKGEIYNNTIIVGPNKKMGQRTKQTFLQRRHTDG